MQFSPGVGDLKKIVSPVQAKNRSCNHGFKRRVMRSKDDDDDEGQVITDIMVWFFFN